VENSWRLRDGRALETGGLIEKLPRSPRGLAKHAVRCGASGSPPRDEEIRAADQMAPHNNAGLIGKAQAPHIERRGYYVGVELHLCGPLLTARPTEARQMHVHNLLFIAASGLLARPKRFELLTPRFVV
jgi:hypothetical protein